MGRCKLYLYTHRHIHIYIHMFIYVCIYTYIYIYILCVCVLCVYVCVCMHVTVGSLMGPCGHPGPLTDRLHWQGWSTDVFFVAFGSFRKWGAHAQRKHGYRNAAEQLAVGRATPCMRVSLIKLKCHLLLAPCCLSALQIQKRLTGVVPSSAEGQGGSPCLFEPFEHTLPGRVTFWPLSPDSSLQHRLVSRSCFGFLSRLRVLSTSD